MRRTRAERSAKVIQKSWRHYRRVTRFRRNYAAKIIQKFWQNFSFHRRDRAAVRIQLAYKAFRLRKRKMAVRVIERWYRKWCEIRRAREIGKTSTFSQKMSTVLMISFFCNLFFRLRFISILLFFFPNFEKRSEILKNTIF